MQKPHDDFTPDDFIPDDFMPDEDPYAEIKAQQAAKFPTAAEQGGQPGAPITTVDAGDERLQKVRQLTAGPNPFELRDRFIGVGKSVLNTLGSTYSPSNPNQRVGMEVGQFTQYAAPAMVLGGASLPAQVAVGGLTESLVASGAGQDPETAGYLGMAAPGVARAIPAGIRAVRAGREAVTKHVTAPAVNSSMEIPRRLQSANIDPGRRIIEDKFTGTRQGMLRHMESQMEQLGPQIEHKLTMDFPGVRIDGKGIVEAALSNAKKTLLYGSDPAFHARIDNISKSIQQNYPNLSQLTPLEAQRLKSYIGENINWVDQLGPHESGINDAMSEIYGGLKTAVEKAVPSVKPDMVKWADYEVGSRALKAAIERERFGKVTGYQSLRQHTFGSTPVQTTLGRVFRSPLPPVEVMPAAVSGPARNAAGELIMPQANPDWMIRRRVESMLHPREPRLLTAGARQMGMGEGVSGSSVTGHPAAAAPATREIRTGRILPERATGHRLSMGEGVGGSGITVTGENWSGPPPLVPGANAPMHPLDAKRLAEIARLRRNLR
ncbi:MAG TPA: hypothetical protein VD994_19220 [Prosthecobacter sp.]|nr:hypothetical protein [Prosthecobacter sp.]